MTTDTTPAAPLQLLRCQELAGQVATSDREAHAVLVLEVAVADARKLIRSGATWQARTRIARAEVSARRILGEAVPS